MNIEQRLIKANKTVIEDDFGVYKYWYEGGWRYPTILAMKVIKTKNT